MAGGSELEEMMAQLSLSLEVLSALNQASEQAIAIEKVLYLIRAHFRVEAAGIRLKDGEDYPYFKTEGFPAKFVKAENYLCNRDASGDIIREKDGSVYHEQ